MLAEVDRARAASPRARGRPSRAGRPRSRRTPCVRWIELGAARPRACRRDRSLRGSRRGRDPRRPPTTTAGASRNSQRRSARPRFDLAHDLAHAAGLIRRAAVACRRIMLIRKGLGISRFILHETRSAECEQRAGRGSSARKAHCESFSSPGRPGSSACTSRGACRRMGTPWSASTTSMPTTIRA